MSSIPPSLEHSSAADCGTRLEPTALPIGDIARVVWSQDGRRAVICLDVGAFLLDTATGSVSPIVHRAVTVQGGAFDVRGNRLVLIDYDQALLWFVAIGADGRCDVRSLPCDDLVDVEVEIAAAVAADGTMVALATADEAVGTLLLVDWASLEPVAAVRTEASWGVTFSPDSAFVIASGEFESFVFDRDGQKVGTLPRTVAFSPDGSRAASVRDAEPSQVQLGRLHSAPTPRIERGRAFLPWGDPNDDVERVIWSPSGEKLAVAVGAWREVDGFDEPVFRTDLVAMASNGRRVATFAEPNGLDSGFAAMGSFSFTPDESRMLVHAETLLSSDDTEPVMALHSFDARSGAWLGALVALQDPTGIARSAGAALDPFGFEEGEGGFAPVLSGRRAHADASLDIDYGEVGSVLAAVTPDGWYGRLDGELTLSAGSDPYDRQGAIGEWLLGLRASRGFGPAPLAPPPVEDPTGVDEAAAQAAIEAMEAGLSPPPVDEQSPADGGRGWVWTVLAAAATFAAYWWLQR